MKVVLKLDVSAELIQAYRNLGYEVVFTECDESNSCYCHDCVQFGLTKHPQE